jgi:hypothetical protein
MNFLVEETVGFPPQQEHAGVVAVAVNRRKPGLFYFS